MTIPLGLRSSSLENLAVPSRLSNSEVLARVSFT